MDEIHTLERQAAQFRALAEEHRAAGHDAIVKKLTEVADELAAKAATLRARTSSRMPTSAEGDTGLRFPGVLLQVNATDNVARETIRVIVCDNRHGTIISRSR